MKSLIAHIACWVIAIGLVLVFKLRGQDQLNARLTSDATLVRGGLPVAPTPLFAPPSEFIFIQWQTNRVPLVVREEVSSNVWKRIIWWQGGKPQTNDMLITSNLLSVTTNMVQ